MTQFKSKSGNQETVGSGLFCYPALMAADILLYQAKIVPVGEDQAQHLELTRKIAERFNHLYGETFVVPETKLPSIGARVMGLDDPTQKMSKSAEGPNHAISMLEEPGRIKKLIGRAVTDSNPQVEWETAGPGVRNLLAIYQAFSETSDDTMRNDFDGMRYGDLKKRVTEMVVESLAPIQERYRDLMNNRDHLRQILQRSADRIEPIAEATVQLAKERTGLYSASRR
jgi:tryptophanyl-tRNA synthetase